MPGQCGGRGQHSQGLLHAVPFLTKWEAEDTALGRCRREQACAGVSGHVRGAGPTAHPHKMCDPSPLPRPVYPASLLLTLPLQTLA